MDISASQKLIEIMKKIYRLPLLLLIVGFIAACNNDDDEFDPGIAPEVPPLSSMVMDVENFTEGTTGSVSVEGRVMSKLNWTLAAVQVGFWNGVLLLNMAVPVLAFGATVDQTPEFDIERGLWVWTNDYDILGRTHTAELTGQIVGNTVEWNMYVSQEAGFSDVLWYSGVMMLDGSSGNWTLRKDANDPVDYIYIEWEKTGGDVGSIRYELVETGTEELGSYIEYGRLESGDYNVYYTVVLTKDDKSAEIEWNDETGEGRVEYNNSGEYFCWDSNFDDVDCE